MQKTLSKVTAGSKIGRNPNGMRSADFHAGMCEDNIGSTITRQ